MNLDLKPPQLAISKYSLRKLCDLKGGDQFWLPREPATYIKAYLPGSQSRCDNAFFDTKTGELMEGDPDVQVLVVDDKLVSVATFLNEPSDRGQQ